MCWPWSHRYEMRASQSTAIYQYDDDRRPVERTTRFLHVCIECGKADVREVKGAWTTGELRGVEP